MKLYSLLLALLSGSVVLQAQGWETVTGGPPAHYGHSMVKIGNMVYVYGGVSNNILSDLWQYDESTAAWTELTPSNPPLGRKFHAAAAFNGKMYIFAGETETTGINSEIWEYDPQTNSWQQMNSGVSQVPSMRVHHRATSGPNKIWITGGSFSETFDEIWNYDVTTQQWEKGTSFSSARYGHAAAYDNGNIIIHGGAHDTGFINDMLSYSISTQQWSNVQVQGASPRDSHYPQNIKFAAHAWEANLSLLWIAGGTTKDNGNYPEVNTTYEYNMSTKQWTQKADGPASTLGAGVLLSNSQNAGKMLSNSDETGYKAFIFGGFSNGIASDNALIFSRQLGVLAIVDSNPDRPTQFSLFQNYPNPFNPATTIQFNVAKSVNVKLKVHDLLGREVLTLIDSEYKAGQYKVTFNANQLTAGIYFYRVIMGNYTAVKKMVVLK